MTEAMKRRLERLEAETERKKPALLTVTLPDGTTQRVAPVAAIDFAWSGGPGSLAGVESNRPEYSELAAVLTAVFGQ